MIDKLKHICGRSRSRAIFVIGTGRSGTHWIGYTLATHPEIVASIETRPMFSWSTRMALDPTNRRRLLPKLIRAYRWRILKATPRHYLDKSHPNIWIAEELKQAFPTALFLGIERNPFATVASMMKHPGVSAWHHRWREFPIPNRFLGIDAEAALTYEDLPFASKCALRWLAHREQMDHLRAALGASLLVIRYESLAIRTEHEIERLRDFLGLTRAIPLPEVRAESLDKWKTALSDVDVEAISAVVGASPASWSRTIIGDGQSTGRGDHAPAPSG